MDDTSKAFHSGFGTTPIALFGDGAVMPAMKLILRISIAARRFSNGRERDLDLLARKLYAST